MNVAMPANQRLQLISDTHSPVAAPKLAAAVPLQADWPRILGDITTLGQVNAEVSNTVARLRFATEPWGAHFKGTATCLSGPGMTMLGLTNRWGFANLTRGEAGQWFEHLDICDRLGARLLRLSLTEGSSCQNFSSLVISQWARRGSPAAIPSQTDFMRSLQELEQQTEWPVSGALRDEWFDADRRHYDGVAVDASLLTPFLETITQQECPLRVRLGNFGLLLQHEAGFFDARQFDGMLRLRSSIAMLEIETSQLLVARIVGNVDEPGQRWLRLYDDDCRCVLVIGLGHRAESDDVSLWQSMLRALRE